MSRLKKNVPKKITVDVEQDTYRDIMKKIKNSLDIEDRPNVGRYIRQLIQKDLEKRP